jgi:ElaB/YqjD/DUF883 family membrane-anchored ribosome-binding protein
MAETPRWKESDFTPPGSSRSSGGAGSATDYTKDINEMRSELSKLSDSLAKSIQGAAGPLTQQLEQAVVKNPIPSVLIAAGIGLVLGAMRRR